jgi:hypothetical protein
MTTTVSPEEVRSPQGLLPPDEKFWKRHSPHGEAPLSLAGSIAVHVLAAGVLLVFAVYVASLFVRSAPSLPVEAIRVVGDNGPGVPGEPGNVGPDGPGPRENVPEVGPGTGDNDPPGNEEPKPLPPLKLAEKKELQELFDPASVRIISDSKTARVIGQLPEKIRKKLEGIGPGTGQRGPGPGKKPGDGGLGDGNRRGPAKLSLTQRERRQYRWDMRFTANSGAEYLKQMRDLGAILAFPIPGRDGEFKVVRDLRQGGALLDEDVAKLDRIFWYDTNQQSVRDILVALRSSMGPPTFFVAFMPQELEQRLIDMEKRYVENVLRQKFDEDRITKTWFRVVAKPRGYSPELISVKLEP